MRDKRTPKDVCGEAMHPVNFFFFFLTPQSRFSWVSESFSQDIGRILTWKVFFHENLFIYENSDRFS